MRSEKLYMFKNNKHITIAFIIGILIFCFESAVVGITFFTKDKENKDTISKVANIELPEKEETSKNEVKENKKETKINKTENNIKVNNVKKEVSIKEVQSEVTSRNTSKPRENIVVPEATPLENQVVEPKKQNENNIETSYYGEPTVGKIEIPKTGVNMPILSKVTATGMEISCCLLYSTGDLNQSGNNLIVAHNYKNGILFSNNNQLQQGDKIYITTLDGKKVEYTVYSKFVTTAEDVSFLKREIDGPEISLSTCADDDNYRIIILAK